MKNFFQGNISGDILPLFLYSGIAVPLIQRGTVERGEQECNSADFRLFAAQGFGIDHRKAVVQLSLIHIFMKQIPFLNSFRILAKFLVLLPPLLILPFVMAVRKVASNSRPVWVDVYKRQGFYRQVICNQEQMLLMKVFLDYGQIKVILPVLALLIIYLRAFFIDKINQKLLLGLCGGLFAVFLILVPPMPGWYTWVVPFITVFFIDFGLERYKNLLLDVYKRQPYRKKQQKKQR